jgi:transcriptional/translational regulatory protein YebC/TACO1
MGEEDLMLLALESGADDFEATEKGYEVFTTPEAFEEVKQALEAEGLTFSTAEVTFVPTNKVELHGEVIKDALNLIEALEDHDDVQNVYTNLEADEEELAKYAV